MGQVIDSLLQTLSEAPKDHIHPSVTPEFVKLKGKMAVVILTHLKRIYADCKTDGTASTFALRIISGAISVVEEEIKNEG